MRNRDSGNLVLGIPLASGEKNSPSLWEGPGESLRRVFDFVFGGSVNLATQEIIPCEST